MSRRTRVLIAIASLTVLGAVVGGAAVLRAGGPASREYSALTHAVASLKDARADPHLTISTDGAHQTVVTPSEVTWYSRAGEAYVSKVPSLGEITRFFSDNGFYNYRQDLNPPPISTLLSIVPALLFIGLILYLFKTLKSGGLAGMGIGRSRAKLMAENPGVTFADVAGCDEAITELGEVVAVLRDPERFHDIGARTPRGVLLVGLPGTGKTLLARAVAGEAGCAFFSVSGSEFVEMFVGVGAARVRDLFTSARKSERAIIFIDEIDAVGRHRASGMASGNDERDQTLNQLLVEMDGFENTSSIIVMAATNRPDILDKALLRPGRFDRQVTVDLPDLVGRQQILTIHARNRPLADDVDLGIVARQTPGMSGADLANLLNEASLLAARAGHKVVRMRQLEDASLRVLAGPERVNGLLSPEERRVVAYHEMGHAVVGHVLPNAHPVHKISIVSRGRALGFTMQLPERDQVLRKRSQLTDQLAGLLAGRIAEEIVFGDAEVTSGAADDIEKATHIAHQMVTSLGMSPLGLRAFLPSDPGEPRSFSEQMATQVDAEVDHLLVEAQNRARHVLLERRAILDALAARLLEVETMEAVELAEIIDNFPVATAPVASIVPLRRPRREGDRDDQQPRSGQWLLANANRAPAGGAPQHSMRPSPARPQSPSPWVRRTTSALLKLVGIGQRAGS